MSDKQIVESSGVSNKEESVSRFKLGPIGYNGLKQISGNIFEESKLELRWPYAADTYNRMLLDPSVASVTNFIRIMIAKAKWVAEYDEDNPQAKEAAEFLMYCMDNMPDQTWRQFIEDLAYSIFYGFSVNEKVFTKVKSGKYEGKIKWKALPSRPQSTLTGWEFTDRGELTGVKQNPAMYGIVAKEGEVTIPISKTIHCIINKKANNPEGTASLKSCYVPWKQKTLAEELELVGMTKDLAGVVTIGVDAEYLARAAANPNGIEAQNLEQMKRDAANLSAGEQTYVIQPLAYNESGKELFTFKLTGVEGQGKQYSTDTIILRKSNEIFTSFLADVLKMGQDSVGSYALSDTKNNILALSLEYYLNIFADVINRELVPQTLALNGWTFESGEMPKITFGKIEDRNLEDLGKFIQRTMSVGAISSDKGLDAALKKIAELPEPDYDSPMPVSENNNSRAGDGMAKGSGNGTSNSASPNDNSVGNNENASVPDGFVRMKASDGRVYLMMKEDYEEIKESSDD